MPLLLPKLRGLQQVTVQTNALQQQAVQFVLQLTAQYSCLAEAMTAVCTCLTQNLHAATFQDWHSACTSNLDRRWKSLD